MSKEDNSIQPIASPAETQCDQLHAAERWCANCGTVSSDGTCHCTEDSFPPKEPDWRPHDRKAIETIASLRARIAELETALAPFAGHAWALGVFHGNEGPFRVFDDRGYREISADDLRAARSALASPQREGDRPVSPPDGK